MLMKKRLLLFVIFSLSLFISFETVFAETEPILISKSSSMTDLIFDGKWTHLNEWKQSSHNSLSYEDGMKIHLRTAHQENFLYVFIDPIGDKTLNKNSDKATVCLDGKNEKNLIPDKNDFCFTVTLSQKQGKTFQGDSVVKLHGNFKRISNSENFIAISSVSDENDRYTKIPHPSYEFKIPIALIERSDNYGFYMSVYDASKNLYYSWPMESHRENFAIPSPSNWGDIISPDKSIPEFNLPVMSLVITVLSTILLSTILLSTKTKIIPKF